MSDRLFALRTFRPTAWRADVLMAAGLVAVLVGVRGLEADGLQRAGWLGYVLSVLAALMVAGRRRWPLAVFAATLLLAVIAIALAPPTGAISLPVVIAVYTLAQVEGRRRSRRCWRYLPGWRWDSFAAPCSIEDGPMPGRRSSPRPSIARAMASVEASRPPAR
jgi:hypothetical protein